MQSINNVVPVVLVIVWCGIADSVPAGSIDHFEILANNKNLSHELTLKVENAVGKGIEEENFSQIYEIFETAKEDALKEFDRDKMGDAATSGLSRAELEQSLSSLMATYETLNDLFDKNLKFYDDEMKKMKSLSINTTDLATMHQASKSKAVLQLLEESEHCCSRLLCSFRRVLEKSIKELFLFHYQIPGDNKEPN